MIFLHNIFMSLLYIAGILFLIASIIVCIEGILNEKRILDDDE